MSVVWAAVALLLQDLRAQITAMRANSKILKPADRRVGARHITILVIAAAMVCTAPKVTNAEAIRPRFDALAAIEDQSFKNGWTTHRTETTVASTYTRLLLPFQTPEMLRHLSNGDVRLMFRAATFVCFYSQHALYVRDLSRDTLELKRRGLSRKDDLATLYQALVHARLFARANEIARSSSSVGIAPFPMVKDRRASLKVPSVYFVADDLSFVIRRSVDMRGSRIIVASSPYCHFCNNAVRDIASDPSLKPFFQKYALWVGSPDGAVIPSAYRDWNRAHRWQTMVLADQKDDWKSIDTWSTPSFYFFKNAKLVATITGWPQSGRRREMHKALAKLLGQNYVRT